jgi:hypothetical protein
VYEDLSLEKVPFGFARDHARKTFLKCSHSLLDGYPGSPEKAVSMVLPDFNRYYSVRQ